ncbi:MAG: peptidoglycan-binding protein [Methanosarcinales archaeon]|nr:peptidoglycan-binding protein [Methanosarcinales archaeon]
MPITPGCGPGTHGPDKGGVDWAFGSFTEAAVNDFQEKNRDRKEPIGHLGV